eukprot:TRINITY_DN172_c0_g1_i2.p1 TRINITY_DN172_c0_g1~~TRINITY_DN172_c0_g1_i2.p1  ORF type:complete len:103 (-),score=15.09 TRINITY_DN172_c0_g1_i2:513-821(-)
MGAPAQQSQLRVFVTKKDTASCAPAEAALWALQRSWTRCGTTPATPRTKQSPCTRPQLLARFPHLPVAHTQGYHMWRWHVQAGVQRCALSALLLAEEAHAPR